MAWGCMIGTLDWRKSERMGLKYEGNQVSGIAANPAPSQLYFAAAVVHNPTIFFVRLSVFLFYLRLFGPKRKMRICVYIGIATSLLYLTTLTVVLMAYSIPREGENWIAVDLRAMMAGQRMAIALAVLNAVSDLYILCIPIPVIWGLQLSARDKIGLTVVFMTASL